MICPGCYKRIEGEGYCRTCQKVLWEGKKVFPQLDFNKHDFFEIRRELAPQMSISGIQDKISLKLEKQRLIPTDINGRYILKPVPSVHVPHLQNDIPANEHLTMQLAKQVFKIQTAECGLIQFADGEWAYITKRFDFNQNNKVPQEDFCQLSNRTIENSGDNYKYDFSYEEAGQIILKYCAAKQIEIEKFFKLIVFNYVFANGDAHLKNFSLVQSSFEDYVLSPAYDLISTSVHFPHENLLALDLFRNFESEAYRMNGFYTRTDFLALSGIFGIAQKRAIRILEQFQELQHQVQDYIKVSFLSEDAKDKYLTLFLDRLKAIRI